MNITTILSELKSERDRIEHAITAITSIISTNGRRPAGQTSAPKRRHRLSAAARARIAAAQRARWARIKQAKVSKTARRMSAAGRKRIADAAKRRWAEWRRMQKKPLAKAA